MRTRTLAALLTGIVTATAPGMWAVTTVATEPVGFVSYAFAPGTTLAGLPLLNAPIFQGRIKNDGTGVSGNILSIDASLSIGSLLDGTKSYFIEIVTDFDNANAFEGDRFDLDTAATIASANHTVTLAPSADNTTNTIAGSPPAALANCTVVIRPHVTLGDLAAKLPGAFQPDDVLVKHRRATGVLTAYTFNGSHWRIGLSNQDAEILHAGAGFMLVRNTAAATVTQSLGHVRTNAFVQPIAAGSSLRAEGFPLDAAPRPTVAGAVSRGFTNDQGTHFEAGATLVAPNPATGAITTYTYDATAHGWSDGFANRNATNLFRGTGCVFVTTENADPDYVQLRPY